MTSAAETGIYIDSETLAKIVGARPDQVVKAGSALITALTSGTLATAKLTASAGKKGALTEDQMTQMLKALEEGFRRPQPPKSRLAQRIGDAAAAVGAQVSDTVDTVRDRVSAIDLADVKEKGSKAFHDAANNLSAVDFDDTKDKMRQLGDTVRDKAAQAADSVSEAVKKRSKPETDDKE